MSKEKITDITDKVIIIFLAVQIISISFSIALSSISLGIWAGLWILQFLYQRNTGISEKLKGEIKFISILIALFFIIDLISRLSAVVPEGALGGLKRFTLYLIFFGMIAKIRDKNVLNKILFSVLTVFTILSIYEIILYIIRFPVEAQYMNVGEIRLYSFAYFITTGEVKMLLFLTLFPLLFIKEKVFINKAYLITSLSIIFISMYLTQSRNVFIAVFTCLIIFGLVINRKFLKSNSFQFFYNQQI